MKSANLVPLLSICIVLAACSPQRLQSSQLVESDNGQDRYHMTGYTDLHETAKNSSVHHIEEALSNACPNGVKVIQLNEYDAHNGVGKFLYWDTTAECK